MKYIGFFAPFWFGRVEAPCLSEALCPTIRNITPHLLDMVILDRHAAMCCTSNWTDTFRLWLYLRFFLVSGRRYDVPLQFAHIQGLRDSLFCHL